MRCHKAYAHFCSFAKERLSSKARQQVSITIATFEKAFRMETYLQQTHPVSELYGRIPYLKLNSVWPEIKRFGLESWFS
jgi:hypothetical protein